jgi:RNA polymerase sigma factor (TIGR02999 family)
MQEGGVHWDGRGRERGDLAGRIVATKRGCRVTELTALLQGARNGDRGAIDELFVVLYRDLQHLAHSRLRDTGELTALRTTALVHESYLRFVKTGAIAVETRPQFMGYAARVMRSVIVDLVRRRSADRRGGGLAEVTLDTERAESIGAGEDEILEVNDALEALAKVDARLASVVELRYFGGLSDEEIAESLGVTDRTVRRDWQKARLLLAAALG